ncbi:MAG: DEAD/DEAH box helicase [Chlamydiae bacterium]|nr:DEAD/DEAH box helicase [Chlamydiota bacterium]
MLNFRKLKQDFSSSILKEGKEHFEKQKVVSAKLIHIDSKTVRIAGRVLGQYENYYESEIEIDRAECETVDSNCDCPYNYDCQHIAALLFYIEQNLDQILVAYSKETDLKELTEIEDFNHEEKKQLLDKFKEAEDKEVQRREETYQRQLLQEYVISSEILSTSPFFCPEEKKIVEQAEFSLIFSLVSHKDEAAVKVPIVEIQIALRLPFRSKPLHIPNIKNFIECMRYEEPIFIGGKKFLFSLDSFNGSQREIVRMVMDYARFLDSSGERTQKIAQISIELFGMILARNFELTSQNLSKSGFTHSDDELPILNGIYEGSLENPLYFSPFPIQFRFLLEYIPPPTSKILLNPKLVVNGSEVTMEEVKLFECAKPGMLYRNAYFRFPLQITRVHLRNLQPIREMTIPHPLFGSFMENALQQLSVNAETVLPKDRLDFTTLPYVGEVSATCNLSYLNGELEASLHFDYNHLQIPASSAQLNLQHVSSFVSSQGILARNLVEERKIIEDLFQDFLFLSDQGVYISKSDKKIVEFMTDVIPRNQHRVKFNCPQNLLDQFIYDKTEFYLDLSHLPKIDSYEIVLKVKGDLKGTKTDQLWECISSKKAFIELEQNRSKNKKSIEGNKIPKILVLDLDRLTKIMQLFDELGITILEDSKLERPLWSLANIDKSQFLELPVKITISDQLIDIQKQILGEKQFSFSPIPSEIKTTLRSYQEEGVRWLERLRSMYLGGILADDMGLGKTVQAIVAISQFQKKQREQPSLIVCPTSLLYNWKEEFTKFNPKLKVSVIDGAPSNRKRLIDGVQAYDAVITSYTLLQKDIEQYRVIPFGYVILDEAQHIKNRGTRNAKSVKMIQGQHRLILSGTPIENSLDELWSLFDFLMPGFLTTYDRFVEKFVRVPSKEQGINLEYLRKKVSPFILRRMKSDVLKDLPPVSEIVYHCQLSETQLVLYRSYAESARDELMKLVQRDGFDRVQIHVLATLTRLKQICCHPAIFAKEKPESGDSAKYEMLLELLQTLIEGNHKTVIFSQYTRMLQIMREDLEQKGISFVYLDGSSKNRLDVVKKFNEDPSILVFLVSLKAGGTGLNLVSADTVIHYDMWWNPAVESQATDRVHRIGQMKSVSSYKLVTLGTIEEKIAEMQKRKKGLVKKVVSCDDEAIAKLTWEDVLELLKT